MPDTTSRSDLERVVAIVLGIAIAVSVVHYLDNMVNYADYPQSASAPDPPRWLIGFGWFFFTGFGIASWVLLRRGELRSAALALAVYAGSGLVGFGHYTVDGTSAFPWWRHAHIVTDIVCGIAAIAVAAWIARQARAPVTRPAA